MEIKLHKLYAVETPNYPEQGFMGPVIEAINTLTDAIIALGGSFEKPQEIEPEANPEE